MRPVFDAFHFQTSGGSSFICCVDRLPDGDYGECDPNTHIIRISPRGSGQLFLDTLIHEFLHAECENWRHPRIYLAAGVLSVHLHEMGYRLEGPRRPSNPDVLANTLAVMLNQVAREFDGPKVRGVAGSMAVFLSHAGYRRMRRGSGNGNANGKSGGSGASGHGTRSRRGGRGKRGKRIGFTPPEGTPADQEAGGVDGKRARERRRCLRPYVTEVV